MRILSLALVRIGAAITGRYFNERKIMQVTFYLKEESLNRWRQLINKSAFIRWALREKFAEYKATGEDVKEGRENSAH